MHGVGGATGGLKKNIADEDSRRGMKRGGEGCKGPTVLGTSDE